MATMTLFAPTARSMAPPMPGGNRPAAPAEAQQQPARLYPGDHVAVVIGQAADGPVGQVALLGHLHGPQHAKIDVAAPYHVERFVVAEEAHARRVGDRLEAGVEPVPVRLLRRGPA